MKLREVESVWLAAGDGKIDDDPAMLGNFGKVLGRKRIITEGSGENGSFDGHLMAISSDTQAVYGLSGRVIMRVGVLYLANLNGVYLFFSLISIYCAHTTSIV